ISAEQDILNRQSVLHSDTGSVTFSGSLTPNGHCEMSSDTGSVDVTLPSEAAFHIEATTNSGTFSSSFPGLNVEQLNALGSIVHGDVGNTPRANLTLKTNTGAIDIHQG
ncbi:MAG: hypothetical protein ACJ788_06555, partial [Ktedonobacteraceae bacterium]